VPQPRWLLFIHQLPPKPAYLRVKIGRRLARIGAVALKNSVYILPHSETGIEDLQWLRREIVDEGGSATVVDAQFIEGLAKGDVESLFRSARDRDYAAIADELRKLGKSVRPRASAAKRQAIESELARLDQRIADVATIDFFASSGRQVVDGLLSDLRSRLSPAAKPKRRGGVERFEGRIWVTRIGVRVDRIASAWLVRRFIDPAATFEFVPATGYAPEPGRVRFDMFEAEFSHEGDDCTFEVLCARQRLRDPGLSAIAELVHDIDIKDGKYERPETPGLAALIDGLTLAEHDDHVRLEQGGRIFDHLYDYFRRGRGP
jgi:hypothetical protein